METTKVFDFKTSLIISIVNTILSIILFFITLGVLTANIMAVADGTGNSATIGEILFYITLVFPVIPLISIVFFWIALYIKAGKSWLFFSVLPWVYTLFVAVLLGLYFLV